MKRCSAISSFPTDSQEGQVEYAFKVVLCGDWGVGKTCLIRRFAENKFDHDYKPSIGVDIVAKVIDVQGRKVKLHILDTGGQERFRPLRQRYYKGANAVIFVFDVTRADSAAAIETRWLSEVESALKTDFERIMIANKIDLEADRQVSEYAAQQSAKRLNASYYEASALDGRNVQRAFNELATYLIGKKFSEG